MNFFLFSKDIRIKQFEKNLDPESPISVVQTIVLLAQGININTESNIVFPFISEDKSKWWVELRVYNDKVEYFKYELVEI
jgi:hypothetical protein